MILLEKKIANSGEVYWVHPETGKAFRRVVAGVAWPGIKPGFLVIVAEDEAEDSLLHERHLWLMAETEERDMTEFIRRCSQWRGIYSVDNLYGDPSNNAAKELVWQFNTNVTDKNNNGLYIEKAPLIEDPKSFEFCVQIIRRHLPETRKTLHLGADSRLPAILASAGDLVMTAQADDYPAIAALGYAVGALDVWKPQERQIQRAMDDHYDIFTL